MILFLAMEEKEGKEGRKLWHKNEMVNIFKIIPQLVTY
jgi:hypothetical protein